MRFADYADPDTPYMFHCHLLSHEDHGMMGQFVVVKPGTTPARSSIRTIDRALPSRQTPTARHGAPE